MFERPLKAITVNPLNNSKEIFTCVMIVNRMLTAKNYAILGENWPRISMKQPNLPILWETDVYPVPVLGGIALSL